jgi:hypothetical protein
MGEGVDVSQTIQELEQRTDLIKGYKHPWLYLFTKYRISGKEKGERDSAGIRFVDLSDMYA